ncbi:uncharacterized protein MAM_06311 [Metarhizium album ARSEF 1941]|uniref:Complex 1 LYR protein domain-containing protein n=1 Tax=Metarhizium album (strain ARSEF 1941) TaxID=1081103 RepID=A0A0B2WQM6_METAS|nr:uncharacterized protein MAM_06311 [Metarhizium album ARSEF 1941]KHN95949.1 hypothetical protein MAM_06311 [Metarhizium album ARSEF 1941]
MHRRPFIPASNSRHRIAALSLYRALLRSAGKIDVPTDAQNPTPGAAMARAVRKAFVKNRAYTSSRLVYASMVAGYKFLTLFSKAQRPGSPEHAELTAHLRARGRIHPPASRAEPSRPALRPREPFLKRVAVLDDGHPVYEPTYVPHSFKYRIPYVSTTAEGQPFLRLKKPQPKGLSRMVGRKGRIFTDKVRKLVGVDEKLGWDAAQEDSWDRLMAQQMRDEGVPGEETERLAANDGGQQAYEDSFAWSVQLTRLWWEWQVELMWRDWNARGEALNQLVEEQRAQMRGRDGDADSRSVQERRLEDGNVPEASRPLQKPNVGVFPGPPYALTASSISSVLSKQMARQQADSPESHVDPFTGPAWNALVHAQHRRLLKWAGQGATGKG